MRLFVHAAWMVILAVGLGFGLSYYALTDGRLFATYSTGPWLAWPAAGTPEPDPYTLAYLSRRGALQLGTSEGVEFVADRDSDGEPLELTCTYRLEGAMPLAAFWTLVAVDEAGGNLATSSALPFLDSDHVAREPDGTIVLRTGPALAPGNWLQVDGAGAYRLVLRLYDSAFREAVTTTTEFELPVIAREACQ